jgi:hypothetical protein
MKIIIPNNFLYQLLFVLCIAIPYLNIFELTIFVWTFSFFLSITRTYSFSFLRLSVPFLIIIIIAFVAMLFNDYQNYFIIRDVTYLIKPIIGFFIGYQLCKKNSHKIFKLITYTGLFIAVIHIIVLIYAVIVLHASSVNVIREYGGYFSDFEVYVLIILLFHKNFELEFSKKKTQYFTIIIGLSVFLYLARTNFIQLLILFLAMKGLLKINKTSIIATVTIIVISIISYTSILYINPKRNGAGVEAFLYKIKVAPMEAFKTKINREDYIDFNDNYRSYENIMTIRQVSKDGLWSVLFGKGLGSQIDLKQKVYLGDMELRYISILHNGFMIVFLKSGIIGILFYFYTIYYFLKKRKTESIILKQIYLLFIGTGVFLIISNWVFLGLYNLMDTKTILIGSLIAYSENSYKKYI